jgi:hypothetical protein
MLKDINIRFVEFSYCEFLWIENIWFEHNYFYLFKFNSIILFFYIQIKSFLSMNGDTTGFGVGSWHLASKIETLGNGLRGDIYLIFILFISTIYYYLLST